VLPVLPTFVELPVLPLTLPALFTEPVEPMRLLVADGAPVLPALGAEVPVFELPVLPLALPALFTEPVEPIRLLVADGAPVLVPLLPVEF